MPQKSTPTPFLTPFEECLQLELNLPPLTHFNLRPQEKRTHDNYKQLLCTLKQDMKNHSVAIIAAHKGPGLILIHKTTLAAFYSEYLDTTGYLITATQYLSCIAKLKHALGQIEANTNLHNTDDRPPTMYLKNKNPKPTITTETTQHNEIYIYTIGPKQLTKRISRPIVNHKNSITTCTSSFLRKHITPIIENCPYLTQKHLRNNKTTEPIRRTRRNILWKHRSLLPQHPTQPSD